MSETEAAEPDSATPDTTEEPERESYFGQFTQADRRLALITVGGTLAANLITVLVVAAAIIWTRSASTGHSKTLSYQNWLDTTMLLAVVLLVFFTLQSRWQPRGRLRVLKPVIFLGVVGSTVFTLVSLLILIGIATGLK